jgi:hypothetical protein
MRIHNTFGVIVMCLLIVPGAAAQAVEDMPGYYPLEELDVFGAGKVEVDIDLGPPMMQIMAAAAQDKEAEFAELASQLSRIRVRVGSVGDADVAMVSEQIERAIRELESDGWKPMIRVNEEDEIVRLYSMGSDETIEGLTLLVYSDGDEVVLANIVGTMDPRLVGKVVAKLEDFPDLDELGVHLGGSEEDSE